MKIFGVNGAALVKLQDQIKLTWNDVVSKELGFYFYPFHCMGGKIQRLEIYHQNFEGLVASIDLDYSQDGNQANVLYLNHNEKIVESILKSSGLSHTASALGNLSFLLYCLGN